MAVLCTMCMVRAVCVYKELMGCVQLCTVRVLNVYSLFTSCILTPCALPCRVSRTGDRGFEPWSSQTNGL